MRFHIGLALLSLFVLAACSSVYTFQDAYDDMEKIDNKYSISFREERLNASMINYDLINPALDDFHDLRSKIENKRGPEIQDSLDLIDARISMIESERYYLMAGIIGDAGRTVDGFTCADSLRIIDFTSYYTKSWSNAIDFMTLIDGILARNKATWDIIGVNREKPKFYKSPLDYISYEIRFNIGNLRNQCNIDLTKR